MENGTQEARALLSEGYGLGQIDRIIEPPGAQWNSTLLIEATGKVLHFKRYRARYREESVRFGHFVVASLHEEGYGRAIEYLPTLSGEPFLERAGRFYDLSPAIEGERRRMPSGDRALLETTATELARLHLVLERIRPTFRPAWTHAFHLDDCAPVLASHVGLQWELLGEDEGWARRLIERVLAFLERESRQVGLAGLRRRYGIVVHGDFTLDNLLFEGENVSGVVDWESANPGELPHYDILDGAKSFFPAFVFDGDILARFLACYRNVRPLAEDGSALFSAMWLFKRLKWVLKLLTLMDASTVPRALATLRSLARDFGELPAG